MPEQDRDIPPLFTVGLLQLLVVFLLFIALLNRQRDLTVLALLVLVLTLGARWWAALSLSNLNGSCSIDKQTLFPDETLLLDVTIENNKVLPIRLRTDVPVATSLHPAGLKALVKESTLWWRQAAHFQWALVARTRGVHEIGSPRILAGDLFSFYSKTKTTGQPRQVIVYPRLVPLQHVALPRRDVFGMPGAASPVQDPVYILGTRDYQSGHSAKHIHWKASARHGRLQEKIFEPSIQEKALILVDVESFVRSGAETEFEQTLEVVASLAMQLMKRGCAFGLGTNGAMVGEHSGWVPVSRNPRQLPVLLEVLARLKMESRGDMMAGLLLGSELPWGVSCVHFSYEEDRSLAALEKFLFRRRIPLVSFVCRTRLTAERGTDIVRARVHSLKKICATA